MVCCRLDDLVGVFEVGREDGGARSFGEVALCESGASKGILGGQNWYFQMM